MGKQNALGAWQTTRRQALDSLVLARQTIASNHSGHSKGSVSAETAGVVENIDRALYPVLAAEFQGYCRDLHGDAVAAIIAEAQWPTEQIARVSAAAMQDKRGLDRKNPASSVIGDDFRALGLKLWNRVQEEHPEDYPDWRRSLDTLVNIRNAVSHSDRKRLKDFTSKKQLTFAYWQSTRKDLDLLTIAMDSAVRTYLVEIATPPPHIQQKETDHD
ncbi:hypothetical protein ACTXKY_14645 [Corynebacterium variabile]|uniref:hypothetical protein n=1 Tax=Corynebacterium variabile TaxID=1727 RepID=UPI003FD3D502